MRRDLDAFGVENERARSMHVPACHERGLHIQKQHAHLGTVFTLDATSGQVQSDGCPSRKRDAFPRISDAWPMGRVAVGANLLNLLERDMEYTLLGVVLDSRARCTQVLRSAL